MSETHLEILSQSTYRLYLQFLRQIFGLELKSISRRVEFYKAQMDLQVTSTTPLELSASETTIISSEIRKLWICSLFLQHQSPKYLL